MWTQPQAPDGGFWGELHSATLHPRLLDSINTLEFDPLEEALWVGTEGGFVGQLQIPSLDRHCSIPAHHSNVLALKSLGEAALALSSTELTVHSSGGTHRLTYVDEVRACCGCREELPEGWVRVLMHSRLPTFLVSTYHVGVDAVAPSASLLPLLSCLLVAGW
jgi:hypothetical protein